MTKPPTVATSDYLNRPPRTLAEVERDRPESKIRRLLMDTPFLNLKESLTK